MALRAVCEEQPLPNGARFRVSRHDCQILLSEPVEDGAILGFSLLRLGLVLSARCPAVDSRVAAQSGVQRQISQRERDGQIEQPHPPARQRIVVFGQVPVPHVAVKLSLFPVRAPLGALAPEQYHAGDDCDERQCCHVPAPDAVDEIAHRFVPVLVSGVSSPKSLLLNGSRAASSKSRLRLRLYAQATIPRKATNDNTVITTRRSSMSMLLLHVLQ